jgi:hypothetical protein
MVFLAKRISGNITSGEIGAKSAKKTEFDRMAVGVRAGGPARSDAAIGAAHVFDDKGLSQRSSHPLDQDSRQHIRRSACRKGDDHCNARGSVAGDAIYNKALKDFRAGKQVPLMTMVLNEFDRNPSGLLLPDGKVLKRFKGKRIARVGWKMVRGLHFHHAGEVPPEDWPTLSVQLFPLTETPPPEITLPNDVLAFASWSRRPGADIPACSITNLKNSPRPTTCTIGCYSCGIGSSSGCAFRIQLAPAKPVSPRVEASRQACDRSSESRRADYRL